MVSGSSKIQGKRRQAELAKQGVWVWDRPHNVHGRWVRHEGDRPCDWWGEFVPTKRKTVK
jgi:hypothetical protein